MSKKLKKNLIIIIISLVLFAIVLTLDICKVFESITTNRFLLPFPLYLGIYILVGYGPIKKAIINIAHGQVFDENFLMVLATVSAFIIQEFPEACAVLLFYQVGEWFQDYAVGKSRKSISNLMDIRPDYANLVKEDGTIETVDPDEVKLGDLILVKPGEKIPLDGIVVSGNTALDMKALTGESMPVDIHEGDEVLSGSINVTGDITIKATKEFYDSTATKILDLVETASTKKSKTEQFITKFARWYTPIVVIAAFLLASIPTLIIGLSSSTWDTEWIKRSLNFLIVSCPCAIVISVPLSFFAGIGISSKYGILVKGSVYIERYNKANIFVFDKTGTLTKGNFKVSEVYPDENKGEILKLAAIAEQLSSHPIAISIKEAYGKEINENYSITNVSGKGIIANKDDITIYCGNEKLMADKGFKIKKYNGLGSVVYVAKNDEYLGYIAISDEIKPEAKELIEYLNSIGAKTVMLTGDNEVIASSVAKSLGISEYKASLLPQDKVNEIERLLKEKKPNDVLCFVGDGINDAPVIMSSDIGISMGGIGSDAAIEASDIVLMHDNLLSLITAKKIAKKNIGIAKENIIIALSVKFIILVLSAFGVSQYMMWFAIFGDVGVAMIAILNALRVNSKYEK